MSIIYENESIVYPFIKSHFITLFLIPWIFFSFWLFLGLRLNWRVLRLQRLLKFNRLWDSRTLFRTKFPASLHGSLPLNLIEMMHFWPFFYSWDSSCNFLAPSMPKSCSTCLSWLINCESRSILEGKLTVLIIFLVSTRASCLVSTSNTFIFELSSATSQHSIDTWRHLPKIQSHSNISLKCCSTKILATMCKFLK